MSFNGNIEEYKGVWVVAEVSEGRSTQTSEELMTPARQLAGELGQPVCAVILAGSGDDTSSAEAAFGRLGAEKIYTVKHDLLGQYQPQLYTKALGDLIQQQKPNVVLFGATSVARDYAPRVAIRTGGGLITNAGELKLENGILKAIKGVLAESLLADVSVANTRPQMALVRGRTYEKPSESGGSANVETVTPDLTPDLAKSKLLEVQQTDTGKKKLEDAEVIVSGGRGLQGPENFKLVEELASTLGAAVGASRAVVDAGWRPHAEQVGQTGKTVTPTVYFALGISGAIQHQVGMRTSRTIIAINRDAEAPIFKIADFGIVGDVFEVVPVLTQVLKEQNLASV